jgi:hypothetical protein
VPGAPYGVYDLVAVLPGYLGTQLVYLTHAVAAGLAISDDDSVPVVRFDTGKAAQVSDIGIDGKGAGNDFNTAMQAGPGVQPAELVSDSAAALPKTYYHQFHLLPPSISVVIHFTA